MAFALLTHTGGALGVNGGTSSSIDTTGAKLLVVSVEFDNSSTPVLTDSKSNTWTALTKYAVSTGVSVKFWYCIGPSSVGSGHTITISGSTVYATAQFMCFSLDNIPAVFLVDDGQQAGSSVGGTLGITYNPSSNNQLIVVTATTDSGGAPSLLTSDFFTVLDSTAFGSLDHYAGTSSYQIQGTATNRTIVWGMSGHKADALVAFGPSATSPDVTVLVSDSVALSESDSISRDYLFSDSISLSDASGNSHQEGISPSDFISLIDSATANFGIVYPPSLRGNIDYDQVRSSARSGDGPKFLMLKGSFTAGHTIIFDADGNAIDSGHT